MRSLILSPSPRLQPKPHPSALRSHDEAAKTAYGPLIYLINWLLYRLGNAKIFLPRNPSNKQTEVQQSGLKEQGTEGQLIWPFFSSLVAMTAQGFI